MPRYLIENSLLAAYVVFVLILSYNEIWGTTVPAKLVGFGLMAIFAYRILVDGKPIPMTREFVLLFVWLLLAFATGIFSNNPDNFLERFLSSLQIISMGFVLYSIMSWIGNSHSVAISFIGATILISLLTLSDPATYSYQTGRPLPIGTLRTHNMFGLALFVSTLLSFHYISLRQTIWTRIFLLATIVLFAYMISETGSRKAILGVLVGGTAYAFFRIKWEFGAHPLRSLMFLVVAFLVLSGSVLYLSQRLEETRLDRLVAAVETGSLEAADNSVQVRLALYDHALNLFWDNPVVGIGLDNFKSTRAGTGGALGVVGKYAHSNYMEILVSTGIVGFAIYYFVFVTIAYKLSTLRNIKMLRIDILYYLLTIFLFGGYFVYDFAHVSYYDKLSWIVFPMIIANLERLRREYSTDRQIQESEMQGATLGRRSIAPSK